MSFDHHNDPYLERWRTGILLHIIIYIYISKHILASNSYSLNLHISVAPLAPPFLVSCWFNPIRFVKPQTWVRSPTWNDWLTGWWLGGGGVRHFVLWVGQLWQPKASGGIVFPIAPCYQWFRGIVGGSLLLDASSRWFHCWCADGRTWAYPRVRPT